jgi:predicted ester cyclase
MSTAANKSLMQRYWDEAWTAKRLEQFDALMEPSKAPEEKAFAESFWRAFPDFRIVAEEMIAEGNAVVSRLTLTGTHLGDYQGMAPTGKHFSIGALAIHRIFDGRIMRDGHFNQIDWLGLHRQLGLTPV